jgi:GT2 family glycosyltransferase
MERTSEPHVFVVLLNWNGWRDTVECLRSLGELNYSNYLIVVVDNGSTDDSVVRIREEYPNVLLIETGQNLGFSRGNNVAICYALERGADYVWLLNNDTIVDPHALRAMVEAAEADPKIGAVGSVLYEIYEKDKIQAYGGGRIHLWLGLSRHIMAPVPDDNLGYLIGASLLARRSLIEDIGVLDDTFFMYWEDTDYSFRTRAAGWKLAVAPEARIWHKSPLPPSKKSPVIYAYFNTSAVHFFKRYSSLPFVPILIGAGLRFLKQVAQWDWRRAEAVWRGVLAGWSSG